MVNDFIGDPSFIRGNLRIVEKINITISYYKYIDRKKFFKQGIKLNLPMKIVFKKNTKYYCNIKY